MVEVIGGEWPMGRTDTLKVSHPRGTVLAGGGACSQTASSLGAGCSPMGGSPQGRALAKPRGGLLAEGEQPLPVEGEQLPCSLGVSSSEDPSSMVLVYSSLLSSCG